MPEAFAPGSTALVDIGALVTNDPALGEGPLGIVRDAAIVVEGGRVVWAGADAECGATDHVVDLEGRAVLPGFVDSHAHLVFAGDRADEFAARMSGRPYSAGGIRSTVARTRDASDDDLRAGLRASPPSSRAAASRPSRPSRATGSPSRTRRGRCGWPAR